MPERTAPAVVPASTAQDEHVAASGFLTRAMAPAHTLPIEQAASLELRQTAPVETTVQRYSEELGSFVIARRLLEPEGRWGEFLAAFEELVRRFNEADDGSVRLRSEYLLIVSGG